MAKYNITFARFGYATIEADSEQEALAKAAKLKESEIDWSFDFSPTDCEKEEDDNSERVQLGTAAIELFRKYKDTFECGVSIEQAINKHYKDYCLDSEAAVRDVAAKFGYERVHLLLAITLYTKTWDKRISRENIKWANEYVDNMIEAGGIDLIPQFSNFSIKNAHPGLINLFATKARKMSPPPSIS